MLDMISNTWNQYTVALDNTTCAVCNKGTNNDRSVSMRIMNFINKVFETVYNILLICKPVKTTHPPTHKMQRMFVASSQVARKVRTLNLLC